MDKACPMKFSGDEALNLSNRRGEIYHEYKCIEKKCAWWNIHDKICSITERGH